MSVGCLHNPIEACDACIAMYSSPVNTLCGYEQNEIGFLIHHSRPKLAVPPNVKKIVYDGKTKTVKEESK